MAQSNELQAINTTELTSLGRKIYGRNWLNLLIKKNLETVLPVLNEFIDKKIILTTGDKSKKFADALKYYVFEWRSIDGMHFRTHLYFSYGSVWLSNDVTVKDKDYSNGGHGVIYVKQDVHVGTYNKETGILNDVLTFAQIVNSYQLNKVYDENKIKNIKNKISALEDEITDLKFSISNFN